MGRTSIIDIPGKRPSIFLILTILATVTPIPARSLTLWPRDSSSTCPSSYTQCNNPKLPSNFCCPSSSTCISLDDASSVICCPKGQDCSYIKPITCDVNLQDPALFPKNPVKTSRLNDTLPKCGRSCCPFGYACVGGSTCAREKESTSTTNDPISTTSTSPSTTSTATDQSTTTPTIPTAIPTSQSPTPTPLASQQQNQQRACPSYPSKAIIAGFFPGALTGALLVLLIRFFLHKRHQNASPLTFPRSHKTTSSVDRSIVHISDPIPSHESSYRTDFLLRSDGGSNDSRSDVGTGTGGSRSVLQRTGTRVKSFFSSSASASSTPRRFGNHPYTHHDNAPIPPLPLTPPSQIKVPPKRRQPSTESIRVYSPAGVRAWPGSNNTPPPGSGGSGPGRQSPNTHTHMDARSRPNTTFQEMIDRVGFQDSRGDPCFRVDRGVGAGRGR